MKILKKMLFILVIMSLIISLDGCNKEKIIKIGVAFGVGPASRWEKEINYMEEYAQNLGVELEAVLNNDEGKKPFVQDCKEIIDSGVDVLIIRPRDVKAMEDIVKYAHENDVKIVSYDSLIENVSVDLFVGYDSEYIGELLGRYLSEKVVRGDYILLWGDMNRNVEDMYKGAMKYLEPLEGIDIILESGVPGWSVDEAKKIVRKAIIDNGNKIDAILAFNDSLAGACAEVVSELGIENPVEITGMDAELDAIKRIIAGTQACSAYMDIQKLAHTAVDEAINLAYNKDTKPNSKLDNNSEDKIPAFLLARQLVTLENIDRILIDSGYYTSNQVYGTK